MSTIAPFDIHNIVHIRGVDHPESIGIGPDGTAYTTGTGCQVYRLDLEENVAQQFASTEARCLGTAVDAAGNLPMQHRMCFEPVEADAFDSPEDAGTGARENDGAALQFAPETGPSMSPFTALALLSAAVPARAADRRGGAGSKGARRAILLSDMTESGQDF